MLVSNPPAADTERKMRPSMTSTSIGCLLLVGLYLPSSRSGDISIPLLYFGYVLCLILLLPSLFRHGRRLHSLACIGPLAIVPLLIAFTATSQFSTYGLGIVVGFGILSLLFLIDIRDARVAPWMANMFLLVNIVNIAAGASILFGNTTVIDFFVNSYTVAYPDLVEHMLSARKPVAMFGTHSIAAFFWFLFFYVNIQAFAIAKKQLSLLFAACYFIMMVSLMSVSGLVLSGIAAAQLLYFLWRARRKWFWISVLAIVIGVPLLIGSLTPESETWRDVIQAGQAVLTSSDAGFLGRLAPGGTMAYDIWYIRNHLLAPVGLTYREGITFGDCGPLEYLLRGSIFLLVAIYSGLFYFLNRNLASKHDAHFLFCVILSFELGFTWLPGLRTLCILPFVVLYLNYIRASSPSCGG